MLYGLCENGLSCVYDLPQKLTVEEFNSLITGYNDKEWQREELQGQPILKGMAGPMFNGYGNRVSNGELVAIIRYEKR